MPTSAATASSTTSSTTTTTTAPTTTTTQPGFVGSISLVDAETLAHSWRNGCPVSPENLRIVHVTYVDFDGDVEFGEVVVHADWAEDVLTVFETLFNARYPIESVVPIGGLPEDAEDEPGYANTSAFHCRTVYGGSGWSQHAYGRAIDINPLQNPYVTSGGVWPIGSEEYLDRDLRLPGMITSGDVVVDVFESIGWKWGGYWSNSKDYHHFSSNGR